jgi:hypothetical protein
MQITIYDGKDCIGGNKIYVQIDDKTGFFDFGNNFSVSSKYFHDYLTERSVRGINTCIELDMLPKLNIYRADLIPADLDVSSFKSVPVQAVLLSHAHADHAGMIGVLREDIGVVASPITLAILKAFRNIIIYRFGKFVFAVTKAGAHEGEVAWRLVQSGADAAFVAGEGRISARLSNRFITETDISLEDIFSEAVRILGGSWGGHPAAAGMHVDDPDSALQTVISVLEHLLRERGYNYVLSTY